ncbi:unnamed protein product, partial [Didymodactylos carnosus]
QPSLFESSGKDFNPYDVLGLKKSATDKEIRTAYKELARHWHPDKNSESNAHDQFTKINAAYEILSDSNKKSNYDQYGTTSEDDSNRGAYGFRDPYDMFRSQFGDFYTFNDFPHGSKKTINARELVNDILPNSHIKPYILFGSTNFCIRCQQPASVFRSMEKQFNDLHTIDDIYGYISTCNQTNQVHTILLTRHKFPTLKYVTPCLQYSQRIQCAVFNRSLITENFVRKLPFMKQLLTFETVLLFKDENSEPVSTLKDNELTYSNVKKIFDNDQLLYLPTVTSSNIFNLVCQKNSAKPCFLIVGEHNSFNQFRPYLISLAKHIYLQHDCHLSFIDQNTQPAFAKVLLNHDHISNEKLTIFVIRRWFDNTIEIVNTNILFDHTTLTKLQKNNKILLDIETNLKLYLNDKWNNVRKSILPSIYDIAKNENILKLIMDTIDSKWNYWVERNAFIRSISDFIFTYQFWAFIIIIVATIWYSRQDNKDSTQQTRSDHLNTTKQQQNRRNIKSESEIKHQENQKSSLTPDEIKTINSSVQSTIHVKEFDEQFLQRYLSPTSFNVIIVLLICEKPDDLCIKYFLKQSFKINDSRLVYAILYRSHSSIWLDQLRENIKDSNSRKIMTFPQSTVIALYLRRNYFVPYSEKRNSLKVDNIDESQGAFLGFDDDDDDEDDEKLRTSSSSSSSSSFEHPFTDFLLLLLDGIIRSPVDITEWPLKFKN